MKGQPGVFRCAACRRSRSTRVPRAWPAGSASRVVLTGRSKPNQSRSRGHSASDVSREYACIDCGHVGWSTHRGLERRAAIIEWCECGCNADRVCVCSRDCPRHPLTNS